MQVRGVYINERAWAETFDLHHEDVKEHASEVFLQVLEDFVSERCLGFDPGFYSGPSGYFIEEEA